MLKKFFMKMRQNMHKKYPHMRILFYIVGMTGLEPAQIALLRPKRSASTISPHAHVYALLYHKHTYNRKHRVKQGRQAARLSCVLPQGKTTKKRRRRPAPYK